MVIDMESPSPVDEILAMSGIESIHSQQPTPNKNDKGNSLNSTEDPFSFAAKNLRFSPSPVKPLVADDLSKSATSSPAHSDLQQLSAFTKSAQEIQKRIHNSLISSLKLEQATMPKSPIDEDNYTDKPEEDDVMKIDVADVKPDDVALMDRHTDEVIEFNQSQTVSQFLANFKKLDLTGQLKRDDEKPNTNESNLSEFLNRINSEVTIGHLRELTVGTDHVKVDSTGSLNPEKTSTLKKPPTKQSVPRSKVPKKQTAKPRKPQSSFAVNKQPSNKMQKAEPTTRLSSKAAPKSKATNTVEGPMIDSIRSMEAVRDQLQNMLRMDSNTSPEQLSLNELESSPKKDHRQAVSALVDNLCSGDAPSQSVGLMEMFKPQINQQQIDSGLLAEKQMLTESLEKERYRRKHCERQISELQSKLLDTQQELAVVSSTMQKKDTMIEHLDKTLAHVVGGWKEHEATIKKTLQQTVTENKQMKSDVATQKQLITELRDELMKAVDALNREKQMHQRKNDDMSKLKHTFQQKVTEISRVIDQKNSSLEQLLKDKENAVHEIKQLMTKLEQNDNNYKVMQDHFNEKEKELDEKFSDKIRMQENELHSLKESLQHEKHRSVELERNLSSAQEDFNKLDDLLGNTRQELEETRMQQNILITKHEAEMKNLSALQKVEVEKQLNAKMSQIHADVQQTEDTIRQNHKKQIHDLNEGHLSELQLHCRQYEDRLQQKDIECKKLLTENEERFSQLLRDRTENMRRQMMMKMRNLMQAHCNETLQLMGNTSGMTPARPLYSGFDRSLYDDNLDTSINDTTLNKSSSYLPKSLQFPNTHLRSDNLYEPSMSTFASNVAQSHGTTASNVAQHHRTHATASNVVQSHGTTASNVANDTSSAFAMYNTLPATFTQPPTINKHVTSPQKHVGHNTMSPKVQPVVENIFYNTSSGIPSRYLSPSKTPQSNDKTTFDRALSDMSSVNNSAEKSISEKLADHEARKKSLQKYIEMLLHRAPGDPLNISQSSALASFDHTPSPSAPPTSENKENSQQQSVAMEMSHLLEASTQDTTNPSPDVIPSSHIVRSNDNHITSLPLSSTSAFTQSKVQNKNVHFTMASDRNITVKMPSVEATQTPFTSKEVSDISDMLSSYTQNTTPSGETKEAAQRLLAYLNDYKHQSNTQESTRNSTLKPTKIKSRTNTPSKSLPAWR